MKKTFVLIVTALLVLPLHAMAQTSVLVVDAAADPHTNLDSGLASAFDTVDTFNLQSGTPTLSDLAAYDAVVAFTDFTPLDRVGTGDALADYADQGGCVVMATYSMSSPWAITGRISTSGYNPLVNVGVNGSVSGNLNVLVPDDPIFAGIDIPSIVYDWNNNFAHAELDAGATLLADDGDGINMIARNANGTVIGLNFFPADYYDNNGELYTLFANAASNCVGIVSDTARFKVTKTFSDGSDDEVDVKLKCNSGLPLEQTFTIAGGDEDGVTFVVTDIPESGANCEVTESGSPAGYTSSGGCAWEDVISGFRICEITNTANPATYTVYKDWTVYREGGDVVVAEADVTIECDSEIEGGWEDDGTWYLSDTLGDGETLVATVDTTEGPAHCSASEEITQSGVEQTSVGCGETSLAAGGSHTCTFTNTVFFEGIPTLSQYGLAILVLLTLGVGFIGFRRFA